MAPNCFKEANVYKILLIVVVVAVLVFLLSCSGRRPPMPGVHEGGLRACPGTPNCVSSRSADASHYVEPLLYEGRWEDAHDRLVNTVRLMKRSKIITDNRDYIHAEFTSLIFRFVDDVEFLVDRTKNCIHIRSASRLGRYDFGVNRSRVEEIRRRFSEADVK